MKRGLHLRRLALGWRLQVGAIGFTAIGFIGSGCTEGRSPPRTQALDTQLEAHAVLASKPSAEGLVYVQAVAKAHGTADLLSDRHAQISRLLTTLELEPPAADGTAELLYYELLARTAELMLTIDEPERVLALLEPRLDPMISLPIDRASGRSLVALGDAAAQTGDHALAMSSYSRALEMLSLLLEEAES